MSLIAIGGSKHGELVPYSGTCMECAVIMPLGYKIPQAIEARSVQIDEYEERRFISDQGEIYFYVLKSLSPEEALELIHKLQNPGPKQTNQ